MFHDHDYSHYLTQLATGSLTVSLWHSNVQQKMWHPLRISRWEINLGFIPETRWFMNRNNINSHCLSICNTDISVQLKLLISLLLNSFFFFQFNLDRANAEEFFEVYKGVVSEYPVSVCSRRPQGAESSPALLSFLHLPAGYGEWTEFWTLHGPGDPWHQQRKILQRLLWAGRSRESACLKSLVSKWTSSSNGAQL